MSLTGYQTDHSIVHQTARQIDHPDHLLLIPVGHYALYLQAVHVVQPTDVATLPGAIVPLAKIPRSAGPARGAPALPDGAGQARAISQTHPLHFARSPVPAANLVVHIGCVLNPSPVRTSQPDPETPDCRHHRRLDCDLVENQEIQLRPAGAT